MSYPVTASGVRKVVSKEEIPLRTPEDTSAELKTKVCFTPFVSSTRVRYLALWLCHQLIACQEVIGYPQFKENSKFFFPTNDRTCDGYLDSKVKEVIDTWYNMNVKGKAFEQYVQPVVLPNLTLGDMIDLSLYKSNTELSPNAKDWWRIRISKNVCYTNR